MRAEYLYITKKRGKRAPTETKATRTNKLTHAQNQKKLNRKVATRIKMSFSTWQNQILGKRADPNRAQLSLIW